MAFSDARFICPSMTTDETFDWNGRTWQPVGEAMEPIEMFRCLHSPMARFAYDAETARGLAYCGGTYDVAYCGGTYDVTHGTVGTFNTYTVVNAGGGLVREYRAADTRQLKDGRTW